MVVREPRGSRITIVTCLMAILRDDPHVARRRIPTETASDVHADDGDNINQATRSKEKEEAKSIEFGTCNIRHGSAGGLESALRAMDMANIDCGIFQETSEAA